nr:AAA domain-containing protein [Pseudenhygromyxa sp. WMMC2535]
MAPLVDASDAGRHDAAEACSNELRALHRAALDREEETGANDLYLGHPFLVGNVAPRGSTQGGYGIRAPLILYPVDLIRDGRGKRGFSLSARADEDPLINQSLIQLLFNKAKLALPDTLSRELDDLAAAREQGIEQLLAKLAEIGLHINTADTPLAAFKNRDQDLDESPPFLALEECALLGLFPQSSSGILQDYDTLLRDLADPRQSLDELLAAGSALLPDHIQPDPANGHHHDIEPGWPVVPADPSQRQAMATCRKQLVTVVDGPPGTGKSQLIVNLLADAIRRGERVAVVAEKRAALDVVHQRLRARGLADGVAVVHDTHDDRKPLYMSLAQRIEADSAANEPNPRLPRAHEEYRRLEDSLTGEAQLLGRECPRSGLRIGQLLTLSATGARAFESSALATMNLDALRHLLEVLDRLHPQRELWAPGCWWRSRGRRASFAGLTDHALRELEASVEHAHALATSYEALLAEDPVSGEALARAAPAIRALASARDTYTSPEGARLLPALTKHGDPGVSALLETWSQHAAALARWTVPTEMAVEAEFSRRVSVLKSYAGRFSRFFSLIWWRARGFVRERLAQLWPDRAGAPFDAAFLGELLERIDASRAWAAMENTFTKLELPTLAPTNTHSAEQALMRLSALAEINAIISSETPSLLALGLTIPGDASDIEAFDALLGRRAGQCDAMAQLHAHTSKMERELSWVPSDDAAALATLATNLRRDGHRLRELDAWFDEAAALTSSARDLFDSLYAAAPEAPVFEWRELLTRAWAWAHYERACEDEARVAQLGTAAFDQEILQATLSLRRVAAELRDLEAEGIASQIANAELLQIPRAAYRKRRTPKQQTREAILKQAKKRRNLWPLRRFVREFANDGLLDALPCWLLSPETMAALFPREPLFDLVIFDEASQCTVEAGLCVLLRAKRAVIAGDEKQMPPTSLFKTALPATEEEDRSEEERRARDLLSGESLLSLARTRCHHVGLTWHYRCLDESLIAFSNHAMYDGELRTIPSTQGSEARPLRWVSVDDGKYDKGMNRPEAERVVDLLAELLSRQPQPSVGVVTFNIRQRQTILDAIDERVEAEEAFAELWTTASMVDARDQRPFVKNLESVQGDERDVIVFSLGHAPVERRAKGRVGERYVPARFGPLGRRGGERRLNVAVSRAKSEQYVVASFPPSLLHVGNTQHDGPRLFRAYLEFVHELSHGRLVRARRVLDDIRGGPRHEHAHANEPALLDGYLPLAAQIALALEDEELRVELNLGTSGFRVPLALGRPDETRLRLAVLTDDGTDNGTTFERHIHRPALLALRGWDVMRVNAATWALRRSDVIAEIFRRVGSARAPNSCAM